MRFLFINGPCLNMLGIREPLIYGNESYRDLVKKTRRGCRSLGVKCRFFQSNCEGKIVDKILSAYKKFDAIIINPAAYTHTSIAIADALRAVSLPYAEIHISDPDKREDFRKISYIRSGAAVSLRGLGTDGYLIAAKELQKKLSSID